MKKFFVISSFLILTCFIIIFFSSKYSGYNIALVKNSIEKLILNIPIVKRDLNLLKDVSVKQQRKHEGLITYFLDNYTDYNINFYNLPFKNYYIGQDKPSAYIEKYRDKFLIASGSGSFLFFEKENINNSDIDFKKIKSNIKKLITDDLFYRPGSRSIKDLEIVEDYLYITFTKEVKDKCYNISVLRSEINFEYLEFAEVFSPNECLIDNYRKQSGGRLFPYKEGRFILSVGTFAHNDFAQMVDNMFGKIISFEPMSNDYEILSVGHRNPQGLFYDSKRDVIVNTEHGPLGGDEININKDPDPNNIKNFGWPISSYGVHYGRKIVDNEPLYKSHSDHGFLEPIKFFNPAIGITQIIRINNNSNNSKSIDFLITSMGHGVNEGGDMSIHQLSFDDQYSNILSYDILPIGERIRDIVALEESKSYILILESIPAIAKLERKNYSCDKLKPPCKYDQSYGNTQYQDGRRVHIRESYENLLP